MVATPRSWVDMDESATLRQLFRRVRTAARAPDHVDGALQLVTVVGEPGIGKSG